LTLTRRQFLLGGVCAATVAAVPATWYGVAYEPANIEIVRRSQTIRNLPARLNGLTAVQISDLHLSQTTSIHVKMVELIQGLKPDLVLVTGDFVDVLSGVGDVVDLLSNLKPPRGIWGVAGNWDHTSNSVDALQQAMTAAGAHFLINQAAQLDAGFWIVGVDDPATANQDVDGSLQDVPSGAPRILMAHSPDIVDSLGDHHFDLILSGHTHGGQIDLPMINGAWLKNGATRLYTQGLFDIHGSPLYVNRGIGMTTVPVRIACRPEITHITFNAA
jgi:uncharacterized protein